MTIDQAIKVLEQIKESYGNIKLMSCVQTGPDSYQWQEVVQLVPAAIHRKTFVQILTK